MALVSTTLQTAFSAIFSAMNNMAGGGDAYCAKQMAAAIKTFILAGQVATTDTGAASAGSYAGAGIGTMTIDNAQLEEDLLSTFDAKYGDNDLAENMAIDIDNACKADDTVQATSTGTVTTPVGATSPFSGSSIGKFKGMKSLISAPLETCFSTMAEMQTGGNELFAQVLAAAMDAYLKAGSISINLDVPPFVSGSGSGGIA